MKAWRKELIERGYIGINSERVEVIIVVGADLVGSGNGEIALVWGTVDTDNAVVLGLVRG